MTKPQVSEHDLGTVQLCARGREVSRAFLRPEALIPGDPFYRSSAWFRLRHACLERDRRTCTVAACGKPATHADHIVARAKGGPDTLANLEARCPSCHSRKTVREDGGFGRAQSRQRAVGLDGWPDSSEPA